MVRTIKRFILNQYRKQRILYNILGAVGFMWLGGQLVKLLSGGYYGKESFVSVFVALACGAAGFWWLNSKLPQQLHTARRRRFKSAVDVSKLLRDAGPTSDAWENAHGLFIAQHSKRHFISATEKYTGSIPFDNLSHVALEIHAQRHATALDLVSQFLGELADCAIELEPSSLEEMGKSFLIDQASSAVQKRPAKNDLNKSIRGITWMYLELFDLKKKSILKIPILIEGKLLKLDDKRVIETLRQVARLRSTGKIGVFIKWKFYSASTNINWPPYNIIPHAQLT